MAPLLLFLLSLTRLQRQWIPICYVNEGEGTALTSSSLVLKGSLSDVGYDKDIGGFVAPFFMAPVNGKIVRRSSEVLG